ncbi:MAG: AEC family transporter [Clostridiales bacterium]|nr:AEC family transporter [Clostridiales bacterium]
MSQILMQAGCLIGVILLGYFLRKIHFFQESDFRLLANIALKVTLPASIICNFNGREISVAMLGLAVLGFALGVLYMAAAWLAHLHSDREERAFAVLNCTGYNIGSFTMPFAQGFLGSTGVLVTSLFDTGNAFICLGICYSIASLVKGGDGSLTPVSVVKSILGKLVRSVPFDVYIIMSALCLLQISLPAPVISFAQVIGNANAFVAMLAIGAGFQLSGDMSQIRSLMKMLFLRYAVALAVSLTCFFVLPLPLIYRQTLAILAFSPITSAALPYTAELKGDTGLSSAMNSISIMISIVCMLTVILLVL